MALRAKVLLAAADGRTNGEIAKEYSLDEDTIRKWVFSVSDSTATVMISGTARSTYHLPCPFPRRVAVRGDEDGLSKLDISLHASLNTELKALREYQKAEKKLYGDAYTDHDLVVAGIAGEPPCDTNCCIGRSVL